MSTGAAFVVDLDVFEGPLDLLLDLARAQKIDLRKVSVLALADQYLDYLQDARERRIEVAAEYLVMAAWLAYLKSQLLLPPAERDEPDAESVAADLAARLRRLEAIRRAAAWLEQRPRLGVARLGRERPEPPCLEVEPRYVARLHELLAAYGRAARRREPGRVSLPSRRLMTVEAAIERLSRLLTGHEWRELSGFVPSSLADGVERRAALAAGLIASLELARTGVLDLRQAAPFGPIMVRRRT